MKVVDMFSAQLPCLAIGSYPSLPELVIDNENGRIFMNKEELAEQLMTTIQNFNGKTTTSELRRMKENLKKFKV